ncbi:MAG TPA: hypothetical protein VM802_28850, partial [Chitinophaga sp.]|uniref:hypothetical protein n=1 Tax=Chitinophaga sp. TaxID=1869181 RepID=UPI002BF601A1
QDVVFNEILPDPPTEIPEFIELYNRSSKAISLQELRVCARRQDGTLDTRRIISTDGRLLMPGHMVALTIDAELLCSYYNCRERENIQVTGRLPSMPGNAGRLVLLRYDSVIIDELPYSAAMHHTLVSESKGVSLERLEVNRLADVPGNWTSAGNGGATPGYRNSQQWPVAVNDQHIRLEPDIFSPDNDGIDDRAILALEMPGPGWVANVTVFDANGRPVRSLARNLLLGNKETLYWDGLGEKTLVLPPGIYIFFVEIYSTDGQVIRRKKTIAMARKLK